MNMEYLDYIEFHVPTYYLPYLVNGDCDGISIEEENELIEFQAEIRKMYPDGYLVEIGENSFFSYMNDINGLGADCVTYTVIKFN
jgi:hypothetical protein